ncbi:hypothetical protein ROZALSC1DRAFT_24420, partial [Rozella allomycis CSF55]
LEAKIEDSNLVIHVEVSEILRKAVFVDWSVKSESKEQKTQLSIMINKVLPPFQTVSSITMWPEHHSLKQWQQGVDEVTVYIVQMFEDRRLEVYNKIQVDIRIMNNIQMDVPSGSFLVCNEYGFCMRCPRLDDLNLDDDRGTCFCLLPESIIC